MSSLMRCKNTLIVLAVSVACALGVPSMALAAGSADSSGREVSASKTADTSKPSWSFSGVSLSASRVTFGQPVTVTPRVSGDLEGATYNYVWSYEGGWDLWGSTVKDTGRGTSESKGSLSLTRPGNYTVYVDVTDRSGQKRTMSARLVVYDNSWSLHGVTVSPSSTVMCGDSITYAAKVSGNVAGAK